MNHRPGSVRPARSTAEPTGPPDSLAARDDAPHVLADRRGLTAALRPFHIFRPEPRDPRLDREATAATHARTFLALRAGPGAVAVPVRPEWGGASRRVIRLVVLVDRSLSMRMRDRTVTEFVTLAERSRAFASVVVWSFDSDTADPRLCHPGSGRTAGDAHALLGDRTPKVVLVLTDGVGTGWNDGTRHDWLAGLARDHCVGLLHLLDLERWPMTGIRPEPTELFQPHTPSPVPRPGRCYRARPRPGTQPATGTEIHVPVLGLAPESLGGWAEFVMGGPAARGWSVDALTLVVRRSETLVPPDALPPPEEDVFVRTDGIDSPDAAAPHEAVRAFRSGASPDAFRLAVALAAVPLPAPILRFVCTEVLGDPGPAELTEVLFGGLAELYEDDVLEGWGDGPAWDFRPGVREALLAAGARRSTLRRSLRRVAEAFQAHDPWFGLLHHLLDGDPAESPLSEVSARLAEGSLPALRLTLAPQIFEGLRRGVERGVLEVAADERRRQRPGAGGWGTYQPRAGPESAHAPYDDAPPHVPIQFVTTAPTGDDDMSSLTGPPGEFPDISTGRTLPSQRQESAPQIIGGPIPRRNPAFTGRVELLRRLREQLTSGGGPSVLSALHGMPGVGKSALAAEFAYEHRAAYELIWWIDATDVPSLNEGYSALAQALRLDLSATGPRHLVQAVKQTLQRGAPYRSWLLVFDNAHDPAQLNTYLPIDGPGHLLITTRNDDWTGPGSSRVLVSLFTPAESVELLRKRGPEDLTEQDAARLAERIGHLPAALDQAAVWLYDTGYSVSEFLAQVEREEERLLTAMASIDPHYPRAVSAVLNMSLDRLERTSPGALDFLHVCSLFAPMPIPIDLFYFARNVGAPPELREILEEVERLGRLLRDLRRSGLIQQDYTNRTLRLHHLLRLTLSNRRSLHELETYRNCAHLLLAKSDPGTESPQKRERYAELLPHLWESRIWLSTDPWARELVINTVYATALRGDYEESKRLAETAHAHWTEVSGENDLYTMRLAVRMIHPLRDLGEADRASSLASEMLERSTEQFGADDKLTWEAAREYLRVLRFTGDFQASEDLAADTFQKQQRFLGEDDPATLKAQHEYAYSLLLNGKPREALVNFEDVYRRREMQLGQDGILTIASRDGYLDSLMEMGDYHGALQGQRELTDRLRRVDVEQGLGPVLMSRTLAMMLRRAGHVDQARRLAHYVYEQLNARLGPDNADTISTAVEYAAALSAQGKNNEAAEVAAMSVKRTKTVFGTEHPYTAMAEMNYATILRRLSRFAESRPLDGSALQTFESRLGENHPFTIACSINCASDLVASNELTAAVEWEQRIVEQCQDIFPERHPTLLLAMRNLALDRAAAGEDVQAQLADIERQYQEVLGPDHPATLSIRHRARESADNYVPML